MSGQELFKPRLIRDEGSSGPNVLIVDDIDANLIALEAVLSSLRCRIVYARSGSEALAHLLREEFALILMDVQMPGMDGYETARLVRARRKTEHIPIIFLTAHDYDASGIKRAYDLGAVDFLSKPLDVDVLRAKAQAFIALHERTLEVAELRAEAAMRDERTRQEGEALKRDMERLAESDRRKTALLAVLARELKAPIAPVRSALDVASRSSDADSAQLFATAEKQLNHAQRIVDDLADLTRASAGRLELSPECIDLAVLVELAAADVRNAIDSRGHRLIIDAPGEAIAVDVDVSQMVRVLANLLGNAARYTPSGGTITVSWRRDYGHAVLRVTDTGIGIRPEHISGLFEMCVPTHASGGLGLGLGLALAKQIVELHRGRISASSAGEGRGTTFEIRLRAGEFPLLAARNRTASAQQRALANLRILRVLVVDHQEATSRLTSTLLAGRGHEVLVAQDAKMALALLAEHRPDAAFIALDLPTIDGYELLRLARTIDPPLPTRFIATGGTERSEQRSRGAGFSELAPNPLTLSSVVLTLESE
jgi:signal transduction histidine kinase